MLYTRAPDATARIEPRQDDGAAHRAPSLGGSSLGRGIVFVSTDSSNDVGRANFGTWLLSSATIEVHLPFARRTFTRVRAPFHMATWTSIVPPACRTQWRVEPIARLIEQP